MLAVIDDHPRTDGLLLTPGIRTPSSGELKNLPLQTCVCIIDVRLYGLQPIDVEDGSVLTAPDIFFEKWPWVLGSPNRWEYLGTRSSERFRIASSFVAVTPTLCRGSGGYHGVLVQLDRPYGYSFGRLDQQDKIMNEKKYLSLLQEVSENHLAMMHADSLQMFDYFFRAVYAKRGHSFDRIHWRQKVVSRDPCTRYWPQADGEHM